MINKITTTFRIANALISNKRNHLAKCEYDSAKSILEKCKKLGRGVFVMKDDSCVQECKIEYHYGYALSDECFSQVSMLSDLCGGDERCVDDLLLEWGQEMREIIEGFESRFDRVPTSEEIKWVMSERRKQDIAEIVNKLEK